VAFSFLAYGQLNVAITVYFEKHKSRLFGPNTRPVRHCLLVGNEDNPAIGDRSYAVKLSRSIFGKATFKGHVT